MQAIIVTGGKQYNVSEGDTLFIEKLDVEAGEAVTFDTVLAIVDGENTKFGTPVVEGAKVTGVQTARARRSVSSSTPPRRVTANVRVIVSPTPRSRSARSASKVTA